MPEKSLSSAHTFSVNAHQSLAHRKTKQHIDTALGDYLKWQNSVSYLSLQFTWNLFWWLPEGRWVGGKVRWTMGIEESTCCREHGMLFES